MRMSNFIAMILLTSFTLSAHATEVTTAGQITHSECVSTILAALPRITEGADREKVVIIQKESKGSIGKFNVSVKYTYGNEEVFKITTESYWLEGGDQIRGCQILRTEFPSQNPIVRGL